jgi:magnesium transporter
MAHPLFSPEIKWMLETDDREGMDTFCSTLHPATVAETLFEDFEIEEVWRVLTSTSIENQAEIFAYFPLEWQVEMAEETGRQHMARLIEQMSHDDRADLLRKLEPRVVDALLRLVDEADRRDIATLVKYPDNAAGSIMTTDYAWLPENISVGEAIDRLRVQAPDSETIYYVYVLDEQRRLLGVISLRELILAPRQDLIRDHMETQLVTVGVSEDPEHVAQEMTRYDLLAVPVLDADKRLVGIVTYDDVMDVVVEEATEDAHLMGAVDPIEEDYLEASFSLIWRKRVLWLSTLFLAQMLTFNAMVYFDDAMRAVTVLAMFVPLCISTGGNSGSQAATLICRAMAMGQVTLSDWFRVFRRELLMGLALGIALGVLAFFRTYYMTPESVLKNPPPHADTNLWGLTIVVVVAVMGICTWGTLVGSMLPLLFKRLGVDPGIASSPFVATAADVTGILIFFSISQLVLGL